MASPHPVQVRRVYDAARPTDGARVLVDRLWPRGLAKDRANLDDWERDLAPSTELRKWYDHDPARFAEFGSRYRVELADPVRQEALARLRHRLTEATVTLLTATRDVEHSQARVLADVLEGADGPG